jgi:hypothetical protein
MDTFLVRGLIIIFTDQKHSVESQTTSLLRSVIYFLGTELYALPFICGPQISNGVKHLVKT